MRWWSWRPGQARAARPEQLAWRSAVPLSAVTDRHTPLVAAPLLRLPQVAGTTELVELPPLPPPAVRLRGANDPATVPRPDARRTTRSPATPAAPARPPHPRPPTWEETEWRPAAPIVVDGVAHAPALTEATDEYVDLAGVSPTDGVSHVDQAGVAAGDLGPEDVGEPPTAANDDGLAGIIAMLDAEVARGRGSSPDPFGPLAPPAPADDRPTLLRPTLAESRRRGIAPGSRPEGPAPTAPGSPPEPASSTDAYDTSHVPAPSEPAAPPAPPDAPTASRPEPPRALPSHDETEPGPPEARTSPRPGPEPTRDLRPETGPAVAAEAHIPQQPTGVEPAPLSAREPEPATEPGSTAGPEPRSAAGPEPTAEASGEPEEATEPATAPEFGRGPTIEPAEEPALGRATVQEAPSGDGAVAELPSPPDEQPQRLLPAAEAWVLPRPADDTEPVELPPSVLPDVRRLDVVTPSAIRGDVPARLPRVARATGDATGPGQPAPASTQPMTGRTEAIEGAEPQTEEPAVASTPTGPRRDRPDRERPDRDRPDGEQRDHDRPDHERRERPTASPTPVSGGPVAGSVAPDGPGVPVVAVPERAVASFSRMTGIDLGFVPLVRSVEATSESAQAHARAFTRDAVVYLPPEAGEPDRAGNDALMGHELTHVMQQRALGADAADDRELGDALEAQAYAVERALRGEQVDPEDLAWPDAAGPEPGYLTWSADAGFASGPTSGPETSVGPGSAVRPGPRGPVQRAPLASEPALAEALTSEAPTEAIAAAVDGAETGLVPLTYAQEPTWPDGQDEAPAASVDAASREEVRHTVVVQRLDATDPVLLDELAAGLYPRVRSQLRGELIADRERAGSLTEFS